MGLNPGIIVPGILSLFRFNEQSKSHNHPTTSSVRSSSSPPSDHKACTTMDDTYLDPTLFNDKQASLAERVWRSGPFGWLREVPTHYFSYWTYGRCLRHPGVLKLRYRQLRALEHAKADDRKGRPGLLFLNYYTASTERQNYQRPSVYSPSKGHADTRHPSRQTGNTFQPGVPCAENVYGTQAKHGTHTMGLEHPTAGTSFSAINRWCAGQRHPARLLHDLCGLTVSLAVSLLFTLLGLQGAQESYQSAIPEPGKRQDPEPPRARTFCVLPQEPDSTWVRISMRGVDQVGAHCWLFRDDAPHYSDLVRHMGKEIAKWIRES